MSSSTLDRIEKEIEMMEVLWTEHRFEARYQSTIIFAEEVFQLLSNPNMSKKITHTGIRKALNLSKGIGINKRHDDMNFLFS